VLDLGTGSGAIALALASERPAWQVTAVDRVDEAVALAERNRQRLGLGNAQVRASHWFDAWPAALRPDHQQPALHRAADPHLVAGDVRFEPSSALVAGVDGLDDLRVIVAQAPQHLLPGGWLLLEHGYDQAAAVRLLAASGFDRGRQPHRPGRPRTHQPGAPAMLSDQELLRYSRQILLPKSTSTASCA
jgi:release factor glutamine methyltransferase